MYQGFPINEKVDVFALGCIIYTMLFFKSPFSLEMSLEHANARYEIPKDANVSQAMLQLLKKTLTQDPTERISCERLWSIIDQVQSQQF